MHGCIGQGLQSSVRFPRREGTCEQHQVVCGPTYPLEKPTGVTSGTKHESGIGTTISRAWSGAEIMPPENTGVRPARSWQQAVVLRDNGTMAVADVQFCHGSAHPLLHHFLARQNGGQFSSEGLRERKMRFLAAHRPVQMVCQVEHVPPGLVTLRMVTIEKACWGSAV